MLLRQFLAVTHLFIGREDVAHTLERTRLGEKGLFIRRLLLKFYAAAVFVEGLLQLEDIDLAA